MKTRILSLLITAALIIPGLASCGSDKPKPELSRVTNVYKSTSMPIPENIMINELFTSPDGVKATSYEFDEAAMIRKSSILSFDFENMSWEKESVELPENTYMVSCGFAPDGSMVMLEQFYDPKTEEIRFSVERSTDGESKVICDDLEKLFDTETDARRGGFYASRLTVDGNGDIYIATENAIAVFTPEMKKLSELSAGNYVETLGSDSAGRVYAGYRDEEYNKVVAYIDHETHRFGEPLGIPETDDFRNADIYMGSGYDLFLSTENALYGYNAADAEPVELCNWVNSDIIRNDLGSLTVIDADNLVVNSYQVDEKTHSSFSELILLTRIPDDQVPERYIIRLGVRYPSYNLPSLLVRFNRQSDKYRVVLETYDKYSTEEDWDYGNTVMNNELLAGTAPDLIGISGFSGRSAWLGSGAFLDLYTLLDKDEELDRDDFFPNILHAFERSGKLYELPGRFYIQTLLGKKSNIPYEHWDANQYVDFASKLPEDVFLNYYSTGSLGLILDLSLGSFIDFDKAKCSFDSPEFRRILEYLKTTHGKKSFVESLTEDEQNDYMSDYHRPFRENKVMLSDSTYGDIGSYISDMVMLGEDCISVGYPSDSGTGSKVNATESYAITKNSPVAEGAWEVMKFLCGTSDYDFGQNGFSALKQVFEKDAEDMMDQRFFFYYDGGYSSWIGENNYYDNNESDEGVRRDVTQADIDAIREQIEGAVSSKDPDGKLIGIIEEEAAFFFDGTKSLDETVKVIQDRVSIYVSENY